MRYPLVMLLLLATGTVHASQCYFYWASTCFEIRDARNRDIVHHVLLSAAPGTFEVGDGEQCETAAGARLDVDSQAQALKRFNKTLKRLDGCRTLDLLEPQVFSDGEEAFHSFRKLNEPRPFKEVHTITRLPGLDGQ